MHLTPTDVAASGRAAIVAGAKPVTAAEFAAAMAAIGPFEANPHLSVAVSGGRDSLAVTLLAREWIDVRAGTLTALIVDHRLRTESGDEAQYVAALLRARGITVEILVWNSDKPEGGISEAARVARYDLLAARCHALGILHLLLGHQSDDQAETVLLRLADGSGPEGLSGMAAIVERRDLRLLRPLLGMPRERLAATVLSHGMAWVDDPSNQRADYARVIARQALDADATLALNDVARNAGKTRAVIERRLAELIVDMVSVDPRGFAWLDLVGFVALPDALARRVLGRLAATFGARHYPARLAGLDRAVAALRDGRSAVAGGCRFGVQGSRILVCRESGAIEQSLEGRAGRSMLWDRRYRLVPPTDGVVEKLGSADRVAALRNGLAALGDLPAPMAEALPALRQDGALVAVFLTNPGRISAGSGDGRGAAVPATVPACLDAVFQPAQGLARPAWPLVLPPHAPMYLDRQTFSLRG